VQVSNKKKVRFDIVLPPKYPFKDPQVTLVSNFGHPMLSLADGRDLLKEVATTGWRVGYKLLNIVELLPTFVAKIEKEE